MSLTNVVDALIDIDINIHVDDPLPDSTSHNPPPTRHIFAPIVTLPRNYEGLLVAILLATPTSPTEPKVLPSCFAFSIRPAYRTTPSQLSLGPAQPSFFQPSVQRSTFPVCAPSSGKASLIEEPAGRRRAVLRLLRDVFSSDANFSL